MANSAPFFLSGGSAKIVLNGRTIAFCDNFSYKVMVPSAAPHFLGMYEAHTIEPLSYNVVGSFSIIRYAKGAVEAMKAINAKLPDRVADTGNGIGAWGDASAELGSTGGDPAAMLNPARLATTAMFDIIVYQKTPNGQAGVVRIRDARITGADFGITKRSVARQNFEFMACYSDEDTLLSSFSGDGSHF